MRPPPDRVGPCRDRPRAEDTDEYLPRRRSYGSLKDEAAAYHRDAIVMGQLAPGSRVDQDEIAETLGMSRAPVREALIELAQKGFIDAPPDAAPSSR